MEKVCRVVYIALTSPQTFKEFMTFLVKRQRLRYKVKVRAELHRLVLLCDGEMDRGHKPMP